MSNYVEVRGVKIGEGVPKICVPIVGKTKEEILAAAKSFADVKMDVVEWRVDWFEDKRFTLRFTAGAILKIKTKHIIVGMKSFTRI